MFYHNSLPEPPINPPETEKTSKRITVYVRFAGVDTIEMDVPLDLDLTNAEAVTDYLNGWTREHRPSYSSGDPKEWEYTNLILGEYWQNGNWNRNKEIFSDPEQGSDKPARIFIESIEEE
jgi:hypothetical protein